MTPKAKAEELISKFIYPQRAFNELSKMKVAKECALICVDELIKDCTVYNPSPTPRFDYWQEVKSEIKAL